MSQTFIKEHKMKRLVRRPLHFINASNNCLRHLSLNLSEVIMSWTILCPLFPICAKIHCMSFFLEGFVMINGVCEDVYSVFKVVCLISTGVPIRKRFESLSINYSFVKHNSVHFVLWKSENI